MTPSELLNEISKILIEQKKSFYHFTDRRNISLIKDNGGLWSRRELNSKCIAIPSPGGNNWSREADERRGLDAYVHLCFFDQHPMAYLAQKDGRIERVAFLQINPAVLRHEGVRFTADVSNKAGVPLLTVTEALDKLDLEVIFDRLDWRDPVVKERLFRARKYEILVPHHVDIGLISGV